MLNRDDVRAVILGSKPGARWPESEHLYAANATIRYYPHAVKSTASLHLVGVWSVLIETLRDPRVKAALRGRPIEELIVWNTSGLARHFRVPGKGMDTADALAFCSQELAEERVSYGTLTVYTPSERREIWERASGVREPVLTGLSSFGLSGMLQAVPHLNKYLRKYLRDWPRQAVRGNLRPRPQAPSPFRPSTGVLSLCMAIDRLGPSVKYTMAGVGLLNRGRYPTGDDRQTARDAGGRLPSHVNADKVVLGALSQKYDLTTTEEELFGLMPPCD